MNGIVLDDLKVFVIPGKQVKANYIATYNQVYNMWHNVWYSAHVEEWNNKEIHMASNDFTRQDEIVSLFYKDECVGCIFFKYVSFDECTTSSDSYFRVWDDLSLKKLTKYGPRVIVCSNFTLAKKFRQSNIDGICFKDLLMSFCTLNFLHSNYDSMTGTMRRAKSMHELTYKHGAVKLLENVSYEINGINDPADLVAFYRSNCELVFYENEILDLWESRIYTYPTIHQKMSLVA